MRFAQAIDLYVDDMRAQGRLNSPRSVASYQRSLMVLADSVDNRDPRFVGRDDIKRCMGRWARDFDHPAQSIGSSTLADGTGLEFFEAVHGVVDELHRHGNAA